MKVLVTGGNGFIGSHVVTALLNSGYEVKVLDLTSSASGNASDVTYLAGDVRDRNAVREALHGVEAVIHAAACTTYNSSRQTHFEVNTRGSANVVQACLEQNVERLVYVSTAEVIYESGKDVRDCDETFPHPERYSSIYAESKARAEQMVLKSNNWEMVVEDNTGEESPDYDTAYPTSIKRLATCALRLPPVWGQGEPHYTPWLYRQAQSGKLKVVGDGENEKELLHVENAATGILQALQALTPEDAPGGCEYFLCDTEDAVRIWEWFDQILAGMGFNADACFKGTESRKWTACRSLLKRVFHAGKEPPVTRPFLDFLTCTRTISSAKAHTDFNFSPGISREEGLSKLSKE